MIGQFSRREFGKALGAASAAGIVGHPSIAAAQLHATDLSFPKDFRWGTATAAYQIEGAVKEDGRGPTPSGPPGRLEARGCSSDGRALQSHCRGQGFDSPQLHQPYAQACRGHAEHAAPDPK